MVEEVLLDGLEELFSWRMSIQGQDGTAEHQVTLADYQITGDLTKTTFDSSSILQPWHAQPSYSVNMLYYMYISLWIP